MSSSVEQIKSRLGIADVVGSYIKLEKSGSNFRALCPFHNEKTPSFFVSPSRESYHCFGCNKGGDIFSFVQDIEGVDFLGALDVLARRAGVEIKAVDPKEKSESDRLYSVLAAAADYYQATLANHSSVLEYLTGRGLLPETIAAFRIGFAPEGWRSLSDHLKLKGFSETEMEKTGLIVSNQGQTGNKGQRSYDRFRSRVMFPLNNAIGKVAGFSGRIYGSVQNEQTGKYINSPQTVLYDKSRLLYGFDKAKVAIRQAENCVLVEGQMDLVLAHQAGMTNVVAVSGTALTEKHLIQIKRLTNNLIMAFDADLAGISASRRALDLALGLDMDVKIAELPAGKDPADVIAQDRELWYSRVAEAKHVVDFYLSVLSKRGYNHRALALAISKEVLPYIARISNAIDQAHFVAKISDLLQVGQEPIWAELKKLAAPDQGKNRIPKNFDLSVVQQSRQVLIERRLQSIILWQQSLGVNAKLDLKTELERLQQISDEAHERLKEVDPTERNRLVLEAEIAYEGTDKLDHEFRELMNNFETEVLKSELDSLTKMIKQAEQGQDYENLNSKLEQFQKITKRINELNRI